MDRTSVIFGNRMDAKTIKKAEKSKEAIRYFDRLKQDFDPAYIFNVDILISASEAYCDDGQWELAEHTLYMAIDANHGEISDAMLPIQDRIRYYYHKTEREQRGRNEY